MLRFTLLFTRKYVYHMLTSLPCFDNPIIKQVTQTMSMSSKHTKVLLFGSIAIFARHLTLLLSGRTRSPSPEHHLHASSRPYRSQRFISFSYSHLLNQTHHTTLTSDTVEFWSHHEKVHFPPFSTASSPTNLTFRRSL